MKTIPVWALVCKNNTTHEYRTLQTTTVTDKETLIRKYSAEYNYGRKKTSFNTSLNEDFDSFEFIEIRDDVENKVSEVEERLEELGWDKFLSRDKEFDLFDYLKKLDKSDIPISWIKKANKRFVREYVSSKKKTYLLNICSEASLPFVIEGSSNKEEEHFMGFAVSFHILIKRIHKMNRESFNEFMRNRFATIYLTKEENREMGKKSYHSKADIIQNYSECVSPLIEYNPITFEKIRDVKIEDLLLKHAKE